MESQIVWPDGKSFAFTVFDDCDCQTLENGYPVYDFLYDLGLMTTKSVWMLNPTALPRVGGTTCEDSEYAEWVTTLARKGFGIGLHNVSPGSSNRARTQRGIDLFESKFGHLPRVFANHSNCSEAIYWGKKRLSGINRNIYSWLLNMQAILRHTCSPPAFSGEDEGCPFFWGDICRDKIEYIRNFICDDINTLKSCPYMPYYDSARPYVNKWFMSTSGPDINAFCRLVTRDSVLRLEGEGGACIMYTHFGKGFYRDGHLDANFVEVMKFMASRNGWFVPCDVLLDYLVSCGRGQDVSTRRRNQLERKWLKYKLLTGGTN